MTGNTNIDNTGEERKQDVNVESKNPVSLNQSGDKNSETTQAEEDKKSEEIVSEQDGNASGEGHRISVEEEDRSSRFQEFFSETVETSGPKLTDTLMTYLELKNIDEELAEIEEEKGDLPENIQSMKSEINSLDSVLNEKQDSLSKLEEEKAKVIRDNNSFEEKISKYDEQKFNVRSNKEYDEIVKTIESLFEEVAKNEVRIKEIDNLTGGLSTEVETFEIKLGELKAELVEKQTLLNELDEQYKQEESILREKRNILSGKLDHQGISLYERINGMYKGEATAIVRKGNCSGCYNSIPPQRVIEIKSADKIFTCQSCGRILISEELISP